MCIKNYEIEPPETEKDLGVIISYLFRTVHATRRDQKVIESFFLHKRNIVGLSNLKLKLNDYSSYIVLKYGKDRASGNPMI